MENKQPTAIEQVLTEYVIENANLKLKIKELEQALQERESDKNAKPIQNN